MVSVVVLFNVKVVKYSRCSVSSVWYSAVLFKYPFIYLDNRCIKTCGANCVVRYYPKIDDKNSLTFLLMVLFYTKSILLLLTDAELSYLVLDRGKYLPCLLLGNCCKLNMANYHVEHLKNKTNQLLSDAKALDLLRKW